MKNDFNIVVLDGYTANPGDLSWDTFRALGNLTVYDYTPADLTIERALHADAILTNKVVFTADTFMQLPRLKYIGVLATGYNIIDLAAARAHGVVVTNVPAYSTDSVAQLVFAHILNLTNQVARYDEMVHQGGWCQSPTDSFIPYPVSELAGKTLGIIGLGNIGKKVCQIAQAFGMDVCAFTSKSQAELPAGVRKVSKEQVFAESDFLSLHCPLTDSTRDIVCRATLALMKSTVVVVNSSRGPLVNQEDMAEALLQGRIRAYCADVLTCEPALPDNPLLNLPNAHITSHIAWATLEARTRLLKVAQLGLADFVAGRTPQNIVS